MDIQRGRIIVGTTDNDSNWDSFAVDPNEPRRYRERVSDEEKRHHIDKYYLDHSGTVFEPVVCSVCTVAGIPMWVSFDYGSIDFMCSDCMKLYDRMRDEAQ